MATLASLATHEAMVTLFLDAQGRPCDRLHLPGGPDHAPLPLLLLATRAVEAGASWLLLSHNHPSGIARPSAADIHATRQLCRFLRPLGLRLADHLIHGAQESFSFRAAGML